MIKIILLPGFACYFRGRFKLVLFETDGGCFSLWIKVQYFLKIYLILIFTLYFITIKNIFMKTITIKLFILLVLVFTTKFGATQNLITDGSFNTTTSITPLGAPPVPLNTWCSWQNLGTGTVLNKNVSGGVCTYNILNGGANTWDIQLNQYGFPLVLGNHYRLTFDVRADANRNFGVYIGEESGSWTNLNAANYTQQATTIWQTKTIEFDATAVFALHKLGFEMGVENVSMYFDNIVLQNEGPVVLNNIEIIGTSVYPYDWITGTDLQTSDGNIYTLYNYPLKGGELKFRQNKDWTVNWGSTAFPTGTGYQDGPNIPVPAGTYNISFNRTTGDYNFICTECSHTIGIIGSSVPPYYNWISEVKMFTLDGVIFNLKDYYLAAGELRFRQDNDWAINWGGSSFPTGVGNIFLPNIQVVAGNYNISFNRETGEYYFESYQPRIGILGTALNGWVGDDIPLQTNDGVNYTLPNHPFAAGEAKFRQNNEWNINWGNTDFPYGYGYANGPNIPIPAGNYNVSFDRHSGWYAFSLICPDPILQCNADTVVNSVTGSCGAVVGYKFPVVINECGNNYVYQLEGLPTGAFFPAGTTTNSFIVYNSTGKTGYCSFTVTVRDKEQPLITQVNANPSSLWPPNHKMKNVAVNYNTSDNCGTVSSSLSVSSNEPVNGTGDGDTAPDWVILDNHHLQLRAERSGSGNGRVYTITITSIDAAGNSSSQKTKVVVPHNMNGTNSKSYVTVNENYPEQLLDFKVIPNPSSQYFNIQVTSVSNEKIELNLFDISGRLISTLNAVNNQTLRFGDKLRPGVYMVEIRQGEQRKIVKVVKQ